MEQGERKEAGEGKRRVEAEEEAAAQETVLRAVAAAPSEPAGRVSAAPAG